MQLIGIAGNGQNRNGPVRGLLYRQAPLPPPAARRSQVKTFIAPLYTLDQRLRWVQVPSICCAMYALV